MEQLLDEAEKRKAAVARRIETAVSKRYLKSLSGLARNRALTGALHRFDI